MSNLLCEETSANYLAMDRTQTTQMKKSSSRDYCQAQHSTRETKFFLSCSDHGQKFDVFLSHSGKQKNFVRQLYRDLTNQGMSCFFDQDRESLPVGEEFPPLITKAAKTCRLAVFLLSKEFLQSKWPMLELSAVVEARDANHQPDILPLFFMIPPEALKQIKALNEKWKETGIDDRRRLKWPQALKAIGRINGLKFSEGGNEVEFRDEIVKEIWRKLPTASPRYHVPFMQGQLRMCQEVEDFFNKKVHPNKKGINIAGLHGIPGQGKTTLGKAFCNFKLKDFEGKVCHLEFSRGDSFERTKLALRYIAQCPSSHLQDLTKDQAQVDLHKRMKGQRVLLVLDDITAESIDEVRDFLQADFRENSRILLCARSVDVLVKQYKVRQQSCMCIPSLEEDDAIAILLEGTSLEESKLGAKGKAFALKCAKRGSLKGLNSDTIRRGRTYHPLALKAFGSHLFGKYSSNLSKWAAEINGLVDSSNYGLDGVFALLDKAFEDMEPKYRTIFMLLTIYMPPNMSAHNVVEWLAICCNEEIEVIQKAVEDLCKKAFIEEFEPEIRIHDLCFEFAQCKAKGMGRWLWWRGDERSTRGLISQDKAGFELAKLEQCMYRIPSQIAPKFLQNLLVLQLVGMQNVRELDLGRMDNLRSVTLHDCKVLAELDGMENLLNLAWLQIRGVDQMLKLPKLSRLLGLQHLEIDIAVSQVLNQLGDLSACFCLREITVRCPSLLEFPMLNGLPYLEKVEFSMCDKVKAPLDCRECVELQSIVLAGCCQMAASPLLAGCEKLSKIILSECDAVTVCPVMDDPSVLRTLVLQISSMTASAPKSLESCHVLENLQLLNMGKLEKLPSFRSLSHLTVLKIGKCDITDPPDLTCCEMLEDIYFFTLRNLTRFPNFTLLRKLKKLSLYNCSQVREPPDINGCHELQFFYLLYNDNMKGLSKMDKCAQLEEIKVSWHCEDEVKYEGFDPDSCQADDDLETSLDCFKDVFVENLNDVSVPLELEQWTRDKSMLVMKYFRGVKLHYVVTAPYESSESSKCYCIKSPITLTLVQSKVLVFPSLDRANADYCWLNRVRQYFTGQEISACRIVEAISLPLPLSPRYHVPTIQGEVRMCQKVVDFFNTDVHPNENGICIAGLYGIPGLGKTTLAKVLCNVNLLYFSGKVCLMQFCGGNELDRGKHALRYLTQFPACKLESITSKENARYAFNTLVKGQRVLLVMDNITEDSIDEVRHYLGAELGRKSCIILIARSVDVLKNFNIDSQACMHVPRLNEKEATAILLERMHVNLSALGAEQIGHASKCANRCSFEEDRNFAPTFHPLALKAFGRHLFNKHGCVLSKWVDEINGFANGTRNGLDGIFDVIEIAFDGMDPRHCNILMLLTRHMPDNVSFDNVIDWVAVNCNEEVTYVKDAVENLRSNAFLEEIRPQITIHSYIKEFAQTKNKNYYEGGEAKFRDEIVKGISRLLPQKYHVPAMEGEARICQEAVIFFHTVHPNEKGIRIGGLYGEPSLGKTTLTKAFCNFNVVNFNGNVYHVEFLSGGHSMDRQNLKLLTKGQRILLVLDNIQTDESIDDVKYFLQADLGENSWILLSARSLNVLKKFIDVQSCMHIPDLEAKEAIAILLEGTSLAESELDAKNRGLALQCANRCSFKETSFHIFNWTHPFHPLVLKTYGRHLSSKYGSDLSKWVLDLHGFHGVFTALGKAFDDMDSKYHTIFMLLTVYMPPNLSPSKVTQWLAVNCNEEINFIDKAVEDLWMRAFIEESKPEIRIHDLYMEFAQSKTRKMGRWLFSEDEGQFELAKLEHCHHQDLSQISDSYLKNLCALQVARYETRKLTLNSMKNIRSLTLHNSEYLEVLQGMENLQSLAWLQIVNVPNLRVLYLSSLNALQYLEINTSGGPTQLGDLTGCVSLTEISVRCTSLSEFPRINGLSNLEKATFKACEKVNGPLDCRSCVKLQSIVFEDCWQMAQIPLIDGCSSLCKIVLNRCEQVTECSGKAESSASEIVTLCISSEDASVAGLLECFDGSKNITLWNIIISRDAPSLRSFSNLTMLQLSYCDISEPPDVACCRMLEEVCFSTLRNLESFPDFSSLRKLKRLSLCNCKRVRAAPDIGGCYSLQVFHLLYNDNMKGLPKMDGCQRLERIKVSWQSEEVHYYSHCYQYDDLEFFPDHQKDGIFPNIEDVSMPAELKDWQWMQGKRVRVQQYFCGDKLYYSITAPCQSYCGSRLQQQASNAGSGSFKQVIIQRTSSISAYQMELKIVSMTNDNDDLRFRENVMRAIDRLIPPRIRFPYSSMQNATTRTWLKKASDIKGISVAGLYEVQGNEKTTLRKSFYNFQLKGFEDEVFTLEFSRSDSIQRLNDALRYLTCSQSLEMTLRPRLFLDEERPEFNLMLVLIRYPVPDKFLNDNLRHIARDFNTYWRGRTRLIVHSQNYTIIELSRP